MSFAPYLLYIFILTKGAIGAKSSHGGLLKSRAGVSPQVTRRNYKTDKSGFSVVSESQRAGAREPELTSLLTFCHQ